MCRADGRPVETPPPADAFLFVEADGRARSNEKRWLRLLDKVAENCLRCDHYGTRYLGEGEIKRRMAIRV